MFDVKNFRKDLKLTQQQLAEILGCGQANISAMEKDSKALTPEQDKILLSMFGEETIRQYTTNNKDNDCNGTSEEFWMSLTQSQQKTILELVERIKVLQEENIILVKSLSKEKIG